MDFASLMSAEISKKRPSTTSPSASDTPSSKYIKRGDVEASRQAQYAASQRALEDDKAARYLAKRQKEDDEADAARKREDKRRKLAEESKVRREAADAEEDKAMRKRLGLPELVKVEEAAPGDVDDIPEEECYERLRAKGHPARLFGESHAARVRRLRKAEVVYTDGPIPTTLVLVQEKDMKVGEVPKEEDEEGRTYLFRQLASYFTMILKEWEGALRGEARDTFASKAAWNAMVQSKENMTPVSFLNFPLFGTPPLMMLTQPALPKIRALRSRPRSPHSHRRNRLRSPRTSVRRRQRRLPTSEHRQSGVADWSHDGGYSRKERA